MPFAAGLAFAVVEQILSSFDWKQLLGSGVIITATWGVAMMYFRGKVKNLIRRINGRTERIEHLENSFSEEQETSDRLRREIEQKTHEVEQKAQQIAAREAQIAELRKMGGQYYRGYKDLKPKYDRQVDELAAANKLNDAHTASLGDAGKQIAALKADLDKRQADLDERQNDLDQTERRVRHVLRLEGRLWTAKALQRRPKFRELSRRKVAVVSVLNLKGGVGKTTVTAHLGAALARRGYRVLLVDLDLQGSLTSLLLKQEQITEAVKSKGLVQHFFRAAAAGGVPKVGDYTRTALKVPEVGGSLHVIGATDELAYAEMSLTMQWLLRRGNRDARFLLRMSLHLLGVGRDHDIVLIDCPPFLNISCVNALAASDYLLVPTMLSRWSVDRIPVLLKRVLKSEQFTQHVNRDLTLLGLVANRTWQADFTRGEQDDWARLADQCKDVLGHDVRRFTAPIPQSVKELSESDMEFNVPSPDGRLAGAFAQLAAEIEQELPDECRRIAKPSR